MTMKPGNIVYIKFWDHTTAQEGIPLPSKTECVGIFHSENKLCYFIMDWVHDGDLNDMSNNKGSCILKSTVIKVKVLK